MKHLLTLLLLLPLAGHGQSPRQRLLMDHNWKFSQTDTVGAQQTAFDDTKWRAVEVPHDWSIEGEFDRDNAGGGRAGFLPTGVGWYKKHFVLPKSVNGKSIWIQFDGVYQNSDVWINDHHLGHYPNGYMSFVYDLTPYYKAGENVITVRVDNSHQPNSRWYSGSGIYRHVWLTIADPVHLAPWGTYITTPKVDSVASDVRVRTSIENTGSRARTLNLVSVIVAPGGSEITRAMVSVTVAAERTIEQEQQLNVSSPTLWNLEAPARYRLTTRLMEGGKVVDEINTPFGIRKIEYDTDRGFLLNGKHIKMNGVCLHHDAGSVGAAVPLDVWRRRLQTLKAMGCNAIRTSHNPVAPEFLDLCDEMGFLVMDEIYDEWTAGKVEFGYHKYFEQWAQPDLVNFIHRDRNHPSVVMWSAGNEIGEQKMENGDEILKALIETFHREDPTRPVTTGNDNIAADGGAARLPFLEMLDIVGYNYVDRWHERRELFYSIDRHDHPDWKMVGTESVSNSGIRGFYYGGGFFGADSSQIQPANLARAIRAEQLWKFVSSHDYVIGDFMWTGIDYLGEAWWPSKNASSGVMDLCGFPKDGYYFYQSQWTDKPMLHVFPHWNWKGHEGQVMNVMAYTNCDSVELFLNGKSFGMKALQFPRPGNSGGWNRYASPPVGVTTADLHLLWDIPYETGELKAVGRKDGKVVCTEIINTTGPPLGLRIKVDKKSVVAGPETALHVTVEVVDHDGRVVPDANNVITLSVEGAGKMIGFDNGNPFDHTSMKSNQRSASGGLALAIVRPTVQGSIQIKATSPGMEQGVATVTVDKRDGVVTYVEDLR